MSLPSDKVKPFIPLPPPRIGSNNEIPVSDGDKNSSPVNHLNQIPASGFSDGDDIFDSSSPMFENIPRTLTVNEQPFLRWLKRVFLAILIASLFVIGVTWVVKAPMQVGLWAVAAVWIAILAYTAPEAIIPYKKTRFDLSNNTFRVGQKPPAPLQEITNAYLTSDKNNIKIWLSVNSSAKQGFYVPLKSNKFSMKPEDLLALRTVIPYTSIIEDDGTKVLLEEKNKKVPVSQKSVLRIIEELL